MKFSNAIWVCALAVAATACSNDDIAITPATNPGEVVMFSASLPEGSRTIYDGINDAGTGYKIAWLQGDQIAVASPQCSQINGGVPQGLYKVNIGTDVDRLNYAVSLDKQGDIGVRWGDVTPATFYSIYPATDANAITINSNGASATGTIATQQVCYLPYNYEVKTGANEISYVLEPDGRTMANQFMWAATQAPVAGSEDKTVKLQFNPVSTTLVMNFKGYAKGTTDVNSLMVRSVTLNAPDGTNIAGDFEVNFNGLNTPTFNATSSVNSITVNTIYQTESGEDGRYITLSPGQSFSIKMILNPALVKDLKIDDQWTIVLNTAAGNITKKLTPKQGANTTLISGKVHTLNFDEFTLTSGVIEFNPESWMSQIDDPVYISQLSLPGAWYAWDGERGSDTEGYQQSGTTIANLFNAGVRAFQFETRVGFTNVATSFTNLSNATIVISGTGTNGTLGNPHYFSATSITQALDKITAAFPNNSSEYAVVVLNYSDGGTSSRNDEHYKLWLSKINDIVTNYSDRIYNTSAITPYTTIDEVRGKIIVLACISDGPSGSNTMNANLPTGAPTLWAYTNLNWSSIDLNSSLISAMNWGTWPGTNNYNIDEVASNKDNLYLNYTLANRTYATITDERVTEGTATTQNLEFRRILNYTPAEGTTTTIPTLAERKAAIKTIVNNSDKIDASRTHNSWYLIGAGGTMAPNQTDNSITHAPEIIAGGTNAQTALDTKETRREGGLITGKNYTDTYTGVVNDMIGLNEFLYNEIKAKVEAGNASPVGMVFINQATNQNYSGPLLIREIFEMNNLFYLQREGSSTEQPINEESFSASHASGGDAWTVQ